MTTNPNPGGARSAHTLASRIATVNAFFAARVRGELDAALALLTEDVTWRVDGSTQVPTIGLSRGRDHVRRWLAAFPDHFTPRELRMEKMVGDEDDVLALGSFRHTVRSTGRTFGGDCVLRFSFRGDQICRYHVYEDSLQVARAFDRADDVEAEQRLRVNGNVYALSDRGGRGEVGPVVLVHGMSHDRHIYEPQIAALVERGHRCIALDLPGHGHSDAPPAGWSLEGLAADLAVLLDELVAGPAAFVGLGVGAAAGVLLAVARPDRVSRLALLGPSLRAEPAIDARFLGGPDLTDRLAAVRAPTLVRSGGAAGVVEAPRATTDALLAFLGPAAALSSPEREAASVAALMAALNARDARALASLYAEDAITQVAGMPEVQGRDGVENAHVLLFAAYPDIAFWAPRVWSDGRRVALEWGYRGTQTGSFLGAPPTGAFEQRLGLSFTTYRDDGLIAREVTYIDLAAAAIAALTGRAMREPIATSTRHLASTGAAIEAANRGVVERLCAALTAGDADGALAVLDDDVEYHDMTAPDGVRGKAAVQALLSRFTSAFPGVRIVATESLAAADFVVAECTATATHRGPLGPFAATGKPVTLHVVLIAQLRAGKIVGSWTYANAGELLSAIDAWPPAPLANTEDPP